MFLFQDRQDNGRRLLSGRSKGGGERKRPGSTPSTMSRSPAQGQRSGKSDPVTRKSDIRPQQEFRRWESRPRHTGRVLRSRRRKTSGEGRLAPSPVSQFPDPEVRENTSPAVWGRRGPVIREPSSPFRPCKHEDTIPGYSRTLYFFLMLLPLPLPLSLLGFRAIGQLTHFYSFRILWGVAVIMSSADDRVCCCAVVVRAENHVFWASAAS